MKVVIDTNILLASLAKRSPFRPVFDAFLTSRFTLLISTEVMMEYAEKIEEKTTASIANNVCDLILQSDNVVRVEPYYRWHLIEKDADDNKFVDCAVSGGADYLVTNDKHYKKLRTTPFPKVEVISIKAFMELL